MAFNDNTISTVGPGSGRGGAPQGTHEALLNVAVGRRAHVPPLTPDCTPLVPRAERVRCPKCKSVDVDLVELASTSMRFHQCPDGAIRRVESEVIPQVYALQGECRPCDHVWRIRGHWQISTLDGYKAFEDGPEGHQHDHCAE